ncbi:MAG: hypothetical protein KF819_01420 [Labilithrix sp.]|nr:hypothetical protein [Labilithrix sp.]
MWFYVDEPWQYRILDALPSGVDHAQLERARTWTPEERLEALERLMGIAAELQAAVAKAGPAR